MIQTFRYRTEIDGNEFQHTIHAKDIESSISKWMIQLEDLKEEVYSFDKTLVEHIKSEFDKGKIELIENNSLSQLRYSIDGKDQVTWIDLIKKDKPDFVAQLKYLTTEEGGRRCYVASGYRPHFQIEEKQYLTTSEQLFLDKDKVFPGDTATAEIRILSVEAFEGLLYEGLQFKLSEGLRIVATGVIKTVINEKLKRL